MHDEMKQNPYKDHLDRQEDLLIPKTNNRRLVFLVEFDLPFGIPNLFVIKYSFSLRAD